MPHPLRILVPESMLRQADEILARLRGWGMDVILQTPSPSGEISADLIVLTGTFADADILEHLQGHPEPPLVLLPAQLLAETHSLLENIRQGRQRLQNLSRRLLEIHELERHHLARELHDEIGQSLTALKLNLQAVQHLDKNIPPTAILEDSVRLVDATLQQVRSLSLDLRPSHLDHLGLPAALRQYLRRLATRANLVEEFIAEPPEMKLAPHLSTACFRVAQEALTNVVRHAQAQHVRVEVRQLKEELQLLVRDDGLGFDVAKARYQAGQGATFGLLGMQERVLLAGGVIDIHSAAGVGTEVHVSFSLGKEHAVERRHKRRPE